MSDTYLRIDGRVQAVRPDGVRDSVTRARIIPRRVIRDSGIDWEAAAKRDILHDIDIEMTALGWEYARGAHGGIDWTIIPDYTLPDEDEDESPEP